MLKARRGETDGGRNRGVERDQYSEVERVERCKMLACRRKNAANVLVSLSGTYSTRVHRAHGSAHLVSARLSH